MQHSLGWRGIAQGLWDMMCMEADVCADLQDGAEVQSVAVAVLSALQLQT